MDFEQICKLVQVVADAGLEDFIFEEGNLKLRMKGKREHQPPCPPPYPAMPPMAYGMPPVSAAVPVRQDGMLPATEQAAVPEQSQTEAPPFVVESAAEVSEAVEGQIIKAPLVGVFYAAPAEDAAPFVQVGDTVKAGDTVAIVEAMKLMNEIEAETSGTVAEIYVKNGQAVEYGQPLFRLK